MNIANWVISGFLALIFGMAGLLKSYQPIDMKSGVSWAERFPITFVRFVGISELLGALGLILPWLFHILPILTPVAASALAMVMLLAIFHHIRYKEYKAIPFNGVLMIGALFVAVVRFNIL